MTQKKKMFVISGIPGTGKSKLRKQLEKVIPNTFVYSTDDIIEQWAFENNTTYSEIWEESIGKATQRVNELFASAVKNKKNIIVDKTNLSPKARRQLVSQVSPKDYSFQCVQIVKPQNEADINVLRDRLKKRGDEEGKIIPDNLLEDFMKHYTPVDESEPFEDFMLIDMYGKVLDKTNSQKLNM